MNTFHINRGDKTTKVNLSANPEAYIKHLLNDPTVTQIIIVPHPEVTNGIE